VLPGLLVAMAGGGFGLAALILGVPALGAVAGLLALAAGAVVLALAAHVQRTSDDLTAANRALADARTRATSADARAEALGQSLAEVESALADAEAIERRGPESVFDSETGLLDERVFVVSFERKVAAARRHLRPLCLILVDLAAGLPSDPDLKAAGVAHFGTTLRSTLRDSDIACRLGPSTFGLILEDTPESGGVWAAERLQMAVASTSGPPNRVVAAVATYPNHGLAAQEVLQRAQEALARARASTEEGIGPVEVATADLS
jgi:GGDEF domain-containing protein